MGLRPKYFYYGIRRSGLHLVFNWVQAQVGGGKAVNNADFNKFRENKYKPYKDADHFLFEEIPAQWVDVAAKEAKKYHHIMIVRDPYNLFASRVKHYRLLSSKKKWINSEAATVHWKGYGERLSGAVEVPKNVFIVNYNELVSSAEYRDALREKLGVSEGNDECLDSIDVNGLGSSFDGLSFQGRGSSMAVDKRWEVYKDVPVFMDLFTEDILDLSRKVYGIPWQQNT